MGHEAPRLALERPRRKGITGGGSGGFMSRRHDSAAVSLAHPFRMRVHRQGREVLVAVSDAGLVGKEFKEGKMRLLVLEDFYGAEGADAKDVLLQLSGCTIANLVGVDIVTLAIQHGFVHPDNVLDIQGVPHAQMCTS